MNKKKQKKKQQQTEPRPLYTGTGGWVGGLKGGMWEGGGDDLQPP